MIADGYRRIAPVLVDAASSRSTIGIEQDDRELAGVRDSNRSRL